MYRLLNYGFGFILIYLFILEGNIGDHTRIVTGFALSVLIAGIAFILNWITLNATKGVIVFGTVALGFGGWSLAFAVVFFFLTSSIFSTLREKRNGKSYNRSRRTGYQVWANGFWVSVFCVLWFTTGLQSFLIAGFASLAVAAADTWATEIGLLKPGKTIHILTFSSVEPGKDGGISLKGTTAAIAGASFTAGFVFLSQVLLPFLMFLIILSAGVAGCFIDSVTGSVFSNKKLPIHLPKVYGENTTVFKNDIVNWTATGVGGILALLITQIITG